MVAKAGGQDQAVETMSSGKCTHVRRDKIVNHFIIRYRQRRIDRFFELEELLKRVEISWMYGSYEVDRCGIEGPRYRILIPVNGYRVIVVVEETPGCLLPITTWFEELP